MNNPVITIIIPVFEDSLLENALKSVASQSFIDFECLVIDDGSSESYSVNYRQLVASYDGRFKLLCLNSNRGAGKARACGIEKASGEIIAFLDSDDWWEPSYLDLIYLAHKDFPQVSIVSTLYQIGRSLDSPQIIDKGDFSQLFQNRLRAASIYEVIWRPKLSTPCTSIKKSRILQNFDNGLRYSEDYYFFMKNILLNCDASIILIEIPIVHLSSLPGRGSGLSSNFYQMYKSHALVNYELALKTSKEAKKYLRSSRVLICILLLARAFYASIRCLIYLIF